MPKRFRQTRRLNLALTEDAHRRLRKLCDETELEDGELLSFLFEHFDSVTNHDNLSARLRLFKAELDARKA